MSNVWDDARREWFLVDIIDDAADKFTDRCQICNHVGLKKNYEIQNSNTQAKYLVGSNCIRKFIILKGTMNLEDSSILFKLETEKIEAYKLIQNLLPAILSIPTSQQLVKFHRACHAVLGRPKLAQDIEPAQWREFVVRIFGQPNPPKNNLDRVKNALFNPRSVPQVRVKIDSEREQIAVGSWSGITKTRQTRAESTLVRSDAYKIDGGSEN